MKWKDKNLFIIILKIENKFLENLVKEYEDEKE